MSQSSESSFTEADQIRSDLDTGVCPNCRTRWSVCDCEGLQSCRVAAADGASPSTTHRRNRSLSPARLITSTSSKRAKAEPRTSRATFTTQKRDDLELCALKCPPGVMSSLHEVLLLPIGHIAPKMTAVYRNPWSGVLFPARVLVPISRRSQVSIDAGATVDEVRCEHYLTYIKYQRALDTDIARRFGARDPNNPVTVICYTGCTGSGKSRAAYADFPGAYWKPNGKWWPGYAGQSTVIMDDFDPTQTSYKDILRIIDRYLLQVETKGGYVELSATTFVFTSIETPEKWYGDSMGALISAQIVRRVTRVQKFAILK